MIKQRRPAVTVAMVAVVAVATLAAVFLSQVATSRASDSGSSAASPATAGASRAVSYPVAGQHERAIDERVCQLLALAAAADPSLQWAASRSADDIDEMVALQRQLLEAAADLVGNEDEAAVLRSLATGFEPVLLLDGSERSAGSWSDATWAGVLTARANPDHLIALSALERRCR